MMLHYREVSSAMRLRLAAASLAVLCGCGEVTVCDIRTRACQDDTFYAVLAARDEAWDSWSAPPPIRVISEADYRAHLEAAMGGDTRAPSTWEAALRLLGLLAEDTSFSAAAIDSSVANVAAYYSPGSQDVTIVDHGTPADSEHDTYVLAHELVHAIQDRFGELALDTARTDDEHFARSSIVEGEAVLYANLVMMRARQTEFAAIDWNAYYDGMLDLMRQSVAASPNPFYDAINSMAYPVGGRFVTAAYTAGGTPALDDLFLHPPATTLAVMQPGSSVPALTPIRCFPPTPDGYEAVGYDYFGAMGIYAMLASDPSLAASLWTLALGWRGDQALVLRAKADGKTAVVWRLRVISPDTEAALRGKATGALHAYDSGVDLVLAAAEDASLLDRWDPTVCRYSP